MAQFIWEFDGIAEKDIDIRFEGVDWMQQEMIAYQLDWVNSWLR